MKPGTQVVIFKYNSWDGNNFGVRIIEKEDYFRFCQLLDTFIKENYSILVPIGNSQVVMTGQEVEQCIEIIPLTAEIEAFLDKIFFTGSRGLGFDVVSSIISEVTWKKFLADEEKEKKSRTRWWETSKLFRI